MCKDVSKLCKISQKCIAQCARCWFYFSFSLFTWRHFNIWIHSSSAFIHMLLVLCRRKFSCWLIFTDSPVSWIFMWNVTPNYLWDILLKMYLFIYLFVCLFILWSISKILGNEAWGAETPKCNASLHNIGWGLEDSQSRSVNHFPWCWLAVPQRTEKRRL